MTSHGIVKGKVGTTSILQDMFICLSRMEHRNMKIKEKRAAYPGVFQERCTSGAGRNRIEKN